MNDELKTYLSISTNKFEIFLYDTKDFKNLYKQNFKFDNLSKVINYQNLNKFLEENIFKIEKLSGNFVNNICLIIDTENTKNICFSIRKKNYKKIIDKYYIENLLTDAKEIFTENYNEQKILHILIKRLIVDNKSFSSFQNNIVGDNISIEIQFNSISIKLLKEIDKVLEKYQIQVNSYLDQKYLKTLFKNETFDLDEMAYKVQNGFNINEVSLVPKNPKKKGFFEKFFQLFS